MSTTTWARVTARGTDADIAFVRKALDECVNVSNPPIEARIARSYAVEVHTREEFLDKGYIIPGTKTSRHPRGLAAEGYVADGRELWIRRDLVRNRPGRARHIVRHEISHVVPLTYEKRQKLMKLMKREDGSSPTEWRGGRYEARPNECYADTMAEAMSGIDSPWDDFAYYDLDVADADVPQFLTITFEPIPEAPGGGVELPEPEPPITEPVPVEPAYVVELRQTIEDQAQRLNMIATIAIPDTTEVTQ